MQNKDKNIRLGFIGQGNLNFGIIEHIGSLEGIIISGTYQSIPVEGVKNYSSFKPFIDGCDGVIIMDLAYSDYATLRQICRMSKHIYLEEAALLENQTMRRLSLLQYEAGTKFQLGFKHRFAKTWESIAHIQLHPRIIESSRYMRHTDKSIKLSAVSDLMLPDIDVALRLSGSQIRSIQATGVGIYDKDPDVVHCRIEFYNGCIANLSASKVSDHEVHKTRIFQNQTFITLNHINQTVIIKSGDSFKEAYREISQESMEERAENLWMDHTLSELRLFVKSIQEDESDQPGLNDYINAKFVAEQIYDQLERNFAQTSA